MKVASNVGAAQDAVSGFANIKVDSTGQQVTLGSSNIGSMKDGANAANDLLGILSELVSGVKDQASRITDLAAAHEDRDKQDAAGMK